MKTISKFCIASSVLLAILGTVLIGVGIALGVRPSQLLDLAHAEIPIRFKGQSSTASKTEEELKGYFGGAATDKLTIDVGTCDLTIQPSDTESIYLEAKGTDGLLEVEEKGSQLRLTDQRRNPREHIELIIGVPDRDFREIELDMGVGSAKIQGRIVAQETEINVGVGDLEASGLYVGSLDISLGTGNARISLPESEDAYDYDLSCGLGSITLDSGAGTESSNPVKTHEGLGSTVEKDNHAYKNIHIENGIGDIEVTFSKEGS